MALGQTLAPRLVDTVLARAATRGQRTEAPKPVDAPDNLFAPIPEEARTEDDLPGRRLSVYTWLRTHPGAALAAGAALAGTALFLRNTRPADAEFDGDGAPIEESDAALRRA
jgi:hypothetical protein